MNEGDLGKRDVYWLMERYKVENNGTSTTDICTLFNFWQQNFDTQQMSHAKSFNNKTYFGEG